MTMAAGLGLATSQEAEAGIQWNSFGDVRVQLDRAASATTATLAAALGDTTEVGELRLQVVRKTVTPTQSSLISGATSSWADFGSIKILNPGNFTFSIQRKGTQDWIKPLSLGDWVTANSTKSMTGTGDVYVLKGAALFGVFATPTATTVLASTQFMGDLLPPHVPRNTATNPFGPVRDGTYAGFLGFRIGTGPGYRYAWAEISLSLSGGLLQEAAILQTAVHDRGHYIQVGDTGAIPEPAGVPSGLGLLALGAAGLREAMRRAKAQTGSSMAGK